MQITTVKIQTSGYLVDGIKSVPEAPGNVEYIAVKDWELGKTHDWLILEETFNFETATHDNWLKIQSYEADMAQYAIDLTAYETWTFSESTPVQPDMPEAPTKPKGYYTVEEAGDSVVAHNEWQVGYDAWVADTDPMKPDSYWVTEPEIYLVPGAIVEPTITPLPTLVPNIAEPQYTLDEIKDNKKVELKRDCNLDIESNFESSAMGTTYDYESTLKDQINISGAAQSGITVDFSVIDSNGDKIRVSHNTTQMNQVFIDGVAVMQTKKDSLYVLLAQVDVAVDEAAVNAIVWS